MDRSSNTAELSRRTFLTVSSAVMVSATLGRLVLQSEAAQRHPQQGDTLHYSSRSDIAGFDSHRHMQQHTYAATAAIYTGLTDIDQQGNIVPGIAESWEPTRNLTAWTFRLRIHTTLPDVSLPSNVMHYPANLQAPDAFDTVSEHPIGMGPFKFVSWTRWNENRPVRFENYWQTDAEGHNLPYLDAIIAKPKREDEVKIICAANFTVSCEIAQTAVAACVPPILVHNQGGVATLASAPLSISAGASFGDDGSSHTGHGL